MVDKRFVIDSENLIAKAGETFFPLLVRYEHATDYTLVPTANDLKDDIPFVVVNTRVNAADFKPRQICTS